MIYGMVEIENPVVVKGNVVYRIQFKRQNPEEVIIYPKGLLNNNLSISNSV